MAANMQHMAGVGQMIPQQMRKPANANQVQQTVYQNLLQHGQPTNSFAWQSAVSMNDRLCKTMDLISNIFLAVNGIDHVRAAEFGSNYERDVFFKSPSKEAYEQAMSNKILEFFKKRQANEPNLQNSLNANAQAQAQAAQAQAQAMMNMQAQMGRGMGQPPQQGYQHLQHQMQASQIPQQPQPQPQPQPQMGMGMGMQAGRGGMPPNHQTMGMPVAPNRHPQQVANEMSRLAQADKAKVMDLASKMLGQATEQQKATARIQVQHRLPAQQFAEMQAQGKDPLMWFFQTQAFHMLKNNMNNRLQQQQQQQQQQGGGPQGPNAAGQPVMMQQQPSQQRQAMMNAGQPADFSQFTPNMESIKDQQMNGFMAQQAGQMVVPASNGGVRNATPQPGNQTMVGQQGPNQTPRQQPQQPQQQMPQQQQPPQQQQQPQQPGAGLQQMKMNQAQQSQAHLQMKQMQGQNAMGGGIPPSQSPAMNTLNTPVSRPPSGMNAMGGPGMGQGGTQFGDQRFNQGIQRPNNQAFANMLASMTPDQRQALSGMPPEKLNELMRRWQSQRQDPMAMNAGQMNQQNRPQNQFGGQMNMGMGGQGPQMMQPNGPTNGTQQQPQQQQARQMQMARMPVQNVQAQNMMDQMDLPPQVHNQIGQLPVEVKKWRDLKIWLSQNNSLPPATRNQLSALQQKQFHILMQRRIGIPQQAVQNPGMNQGSMPGQIPNQQQQQQQQMGMARPLGNIPPHVLQVTPQEIMQIRSQRPNLANMPDEQLRAMVQHMKRQQWMQQQQQQQLRTQPAHAHAPGQGQQGGQGQVPGAPQGPMQMQTPQPQQQAQQQQSHTPQPPQQPTPSSMGQTAAMQQPGGQKQQQPQQPQQPQQGQAGDQARNNRPQPVKSLKRPSTDDAADTAGAANANAGPSRPGSQPNQQAPRAVPSLTPHQVASLNPEQRARYEQYLKMQMAGQGQQAASMMQQAASAEALGRLRQFSQEEQRKFSQEPMPEIPMSQQEHSDTAAKLQRIAVDMYKVGRGLTKWYSLTRDDARAKMFFRTRLRIMKQFSDGDLMQEPMQKLKENFSIRSSEIDHARAMLESMAKDLAASMMKSGMMKHAGQAQAGQAASQNQGAQQAPQGQQSPPAPLNAANLEKNTQALSKANQQKQAAKASQVPPAPTATQPPFPFGATSPHGNPSYIGKPKDMNLQLPPARKRQKLAGQQPGQAAQGATPSPKTSKNASPEMRRAPEPPKAVLPCKDPECANSFVGYANEQALQQHVEEEHIKPKEDPVRFVRENLALALGLEPDGSVKKTDKAAEGSAAMNKSASKQGQQTPGNAAGTPMSQDAAMKRTASSAGKAQDARPAGKTDGAASKQGDGKPADAAATPARTSPWASCTIDAEAFISHLGWEKGIGLPNLVSEVYMYYRSHTPKDTPESSKDSGSSEPNSDISEGAALDIDVYWRNFESFDVDLLTDMDKAKVDGALKGAEIDLPLLFDRTLPQRSEWDSFGGIEFSRPMESMAFDDRVWL